MSLFKSLSKGQSVCSKMSFLSSFSLIYLATNLAIWDAIVITETHAADRSPVSSPSSTPTPTPTPIPTHLPARRASLEAIKGTLERARIERQDHSDAEMAKGLDHELNMAERARQALGEIHPPRTQEQVRADEEYARSLQDHPRTPEQLRADEDYARSLQLHPRSPEQFSADEAYARSLQGHGRTPEQISADEAYARSLQDLEDSGADSD